MKIALEDVLATLAAFGQQIPADYDQVLKALGKTGDFKDGVLKVNIPRNDLKVTDRRHRHPNAFRLRRPARDYQVLWHGSHARVTSYYWRMKSTLRYRPPCSTTGSVLYRNPQSFLL